MFFKNTGSKIKAVAEILFWCKCVVYLVTLVVALICYAVALQRYFVLLAIVFLFVLIFGWFLIWVQCLLLYGFGELIENSAHNRETAPIEEKVVQ